MLTSVPAFVTGARAHAAVVVAVPVVVIAAGHAETVPVNASFRPYPGSSCCKPRKLSGGGRGALLEGASLTVRARGQRSASSAATVRAGPAGRAVGACHRPRPASSTGKAAWGYLPQDPRIDRITALTHVPVGRGLDEAVVRIEKLRLVMEEDHSDAKCCGPPAPVRKCFGASGGDVAESEGAVTHRRSWCS